MTLKHASPPDSRSAGRVSRSWSRAAINFIGFTVWYRLTGNMMAAIRALVAASAAAIVAGLILERRIAPLPVILGLVPTVIGTFSPIYDDPGIAKVATTVAYGVLCVVMLGGLALGANPLKLMFGKAEDLAERVCWHLAMRFGLFALGIVLANEIIQQTQPNAVWMAFKFPGVPLLYELFWIAHRPMLGRTRKPAEGGKPIGSRGLEPQSSRRRLPLGRR